MNRMKRCNIMLFAVLLFLAACAHEPPPYPPPNGNYLALYQDYLEHRNREPRNTEKSIIFEKLRNSQVPTEQDAERMAIVYYIANSHATTARGKAYALRITNGDRSYLTWNVFISDPQQHPLAYVKVGSDATPGFIPAPQN